MKYRFCTAYHSGGLEDCLKTEQRITEFVFHALINSNVYSFYGYDSRINANRYILNDMENNIGLPTWLHEYLD